MRQHLLIIISMAMEMFGKPAVAAQIRREALSQLRSKHQIHLHFKQATKILLTNALSPPTLIAHCMIAQGTP